MTHSPAFIVSALASTVGSLGLAILGAGGFADFFSRLPFTVTAIATLAMTVALLSTQANLSSGQHEDRGNRWVLYAFWVLTLLSAFLPAYTDRKDFWVIDGESIRWFGVALYIAGGLLRIWPIFVLGNRFSGLVAIQPEHRLVTDGIYGIIRHPSYLGLIVLGFGWALVFRSGVGLLLAALMIPMRTCPDRARGEAVG
ncbi:MAG: isoprenylcysteine carboxylmethyltransferase family protein [Xanthobacteraceae bacterium]